MNPAAPRLCVPGPGAAWSDSQLAVAAPCLERMTAEDRVQWALDYLPGRHVLTSSFGAQSAVMLHLLSRLLPEIPVILIDTGYLFPETYGFIDELVQRLDLQLHSYRARMSPAWQEVRYGRMWEKGPEGIRRYNRLNKVEPMERAIADLAAGTWFSGLRRSQSGSRRNIAVLQSHGGVVKVHPLADWSNRDIHRYLVKHGLPYHPLWDDGYVSIGDTHTSRPLGEGMVEEDTRFFGQLRECGLHEPENFAGPAP